MPEFKYKIGDVLALASSVAPPKRWMGAARVQVVEKWLACTREGGEWDVFYGVRILHNDDDLQTGNVREVELAPLPESD